MQPQAAEQEECEPEAPGSGLLARLAQLPDPRSRHGRRYPLPALLGIAVAAVLSGAKTYTEVAEFAAELTQPQLAALGIPKRRWEVCYQAPKETALRRLLQRLDAEALDEVVGGWLAAQLPDGDRSAVAVDGKTLRGAGGGAGGHRPHLLAALVHGHGTVVAQRQVDAKTSEIYDDAVTDLAMLADHGYEITISASQARHYPGHTIAVRIEPHAIP